MTGDMTAGAAPEQDHGPGVQAVAALLVFAGVAGGLWGLPKLLPDGLVEAGPATCSAGRETPAPGLVSGARLCTALNRADLPVLLGLPDEPALSADGSESPITLADGTRIASPKASVTTATYSVQLSASGDGVPVARMTHLLGGNARSRTLLGHPAVLYSDHTIAITVKGGRADAGTGGIARHLMVARDTRDRGGVFEVALWRQDDVTPDDAALLRIAERVLPTVPGWTGGQGRGGVA